MKRIAIFCDGTWNRSDAASPTHVVRLAQALAPEGTDGVTQVAIYIPGVGAGEGVTWGARMSDRYLGGLYGRGLDTRIVQAYRAIVFAFEPGDELFIFGFSRGAYTARSLAGMIRAAGIPPATAVNRVPEAMAFYRDRDEETKPDTGHALRFRTELSPDTPTSVQDAEWRVEKGMPKRPPLVIAYLGVWDTVGALGVPGVLGVFARLVNQKYAFHDTELSHSVKAARHAVAIDERRRLYPPALWDNVADLNRDASDEVKRSDPVPYRQLWFPGNHGIVGGSGRVPQLSAFTADWIADGASAQGLAFRTNRLAALIGPADAGVDDKGAAQRPALKNGFGWLLADRTLPEEDETLVSDAARKRVMRMGWRPRTLLPVMDELVGPWPNAVAEADTSDDPPGTSQT